MVWGKIIGAFFGYLLGGVFGAILGTLVGHFFDQGLRSMGPFMGFSRQHAQQAFFKATFLIMGHLAKSDGRITEHELRIAREVMHHLNLDEAGRLKAMRLFNEGKETSFNIDKSLEELKRSCFGSKPLLKMFLELQIQAAHADGTITTPEKKILEYIAAYFNLGPINFDNVRADFNQRQQSYKHSQPRSPVNSLQQAYSILGVNAASSDAEVKRAYRSQMSQNHPDKLMAKGLPEEMIKLATEKTQEIKAAYEQICRSRGL